MNTMRLRDEVWGRGGSCVAMTIQIAMDDSSDKSIMFSKGGGKKRQCEIIAVEIWGEF